MPVAADPAGLRHTVELQQRDAVHLLELHPLLCGQRRGRATHQPERRDVLRCEAERLVEQHIEHGRHAGGEGDAVVLHPFEEAAVREPLGDVQGEALLQEGQQAQHLRRVPAERAVFQRAVVLGAGRGIRACRGRSASRRRGRRSRSSASPWCPRCRRCRPCRRRRCARAVGAASPRDSAAKNSSCGSVILRAVRRPRAEPDARRARVADHRGNVDLLVIDDQRRIERRGQRDHLLFVDLEIERADHRADPPDAEPDQQLFQILVGEQQHAAAFVDAAALQIRRDVDRNPVELAERDRRCRLRDRRSRSCPASRRHISPASPATGS